MSKNYSGTYLYGKYPDYEKMLFTFIMEADKINKDDDDFADIIFEVKRRQVSSAIAKVLKSDKVYLMTGNKPLPRQFKVFCAKDVKNGAKDNVVYVDCTDLLYKSKAGRWACRDIDIFISYIASATHTYIYYRDEVRFTNNSKIIRNGAKAFAELMTYVVDYVAHISSTPKIKAHCKYMSAQYYIYNILGKDISDGNMSIARKIAGLSDREAGVVEMQYDVNTFSNIKYFVESLSNVLHISKLTIDVVVERWMTLFNPSTIFALELFPSFATMITDCYIGAYLNNQKTIEKVLGNTMVEFAKSIFKVGEEAV
jgi:hypothetical protein